MKFITIAGEKGEKYVINTQHIVYLSEHHRGGTEVHTTTKLIFTKALISIVENLINE